MDEIEKGINSGDDLHDFNIDSIQNIYEQLISICKKHNYATAMTALLETLFSLSHVEISCKKIPIRIQKLLHEECIDLIRKQYLERVKKYTSTESSN